MCFPYHVLSFLLYFTDALFGHALLRCQFTSSDGRDAVYLEQYHFNKILLLQYNSTVGKWTGFTKRTAGITEQLNKNPTLLKQLKKNTNTCITTVPLLHEFLLKPGDFHDNGK